MNTTAARAAIALALVEVLGELLPGKLCGESWDLPDSETVSITVTFGALRKARALLESAMTDREPFDVETDLLENLKRMVEHFETWANDRSMEASTETWAALHCAKEAIGKASGRLTTATDHAGLVADLQHLMLYEDPRSEDYAILERAVAALQAPVPTLSDDEIVREGWAAYNDWPLMMAGGEYTKFNRGRAALHAFLERESRQAPVPAEVEELADSLDGIAIALAEEGSALTAFDIRQAAQKLLTLSRTNEALTREHAARVAKVRAEIAGLRYDLSDELGVASAQSQPGEAGDGR